MKIKGLPEAHPILIAEIGGNHHGDLDAAVELARLAVDHGAHVVKFQTYTAAGLVNSEQDPARHKHFDKLALPPDAWPRLAKEVRDRGGIWMTSLWDEEQFDAIDVLQPAFKVGSGDLTHHALLRRMAATGKPLILSTAMAEMSDVRQAVASLLAADPKMIDDGRLCLLQCTALYDEPETIAVDLRMMDTYRAEFPGISVGYSNHSIDLDVCRMALARGAEVLEVHFTTDRDQAFRDHKLSVLPEELRSLREFGDKVSTVLGAGNKRVADAERGFVREFRRAVYPRHDLPAGHVLTASDLIALRPEVGLPAWHLEDLCGRRLGSAVAALAPLSDDLLE